MGGGMGVDCEGNGYMDRFMHAWRIDGGMHAQFYCNNTWVALTNF